MAIEIPLLAFLFALDAFFSAAEIALTALNRAQLAELGRRQPSAAAALERWSRHPSQMLTTVLVSSNLTIIAFSAVATSLSLRLSAERGWNPWLVETLALAASALVVLCAEIAPKVVAKNRPLPVAILVVPGVRLTETLLGPLIRLIVKFIRWMTRPFGGDLGDSLPVVTEEELLRLVSEGAQGGVIEKEESEMIRSVIEFGDTVVREVMIPRTEMAGIPLDAPVEQSLDLFIEGGYSRLPVYSGNFDQIHGIVYAKDFLAMLKERELIILHDIIRPAYFVPETKRVLDLLREFKKGRFHLAIVVDEFGGTSGLVTLEDLVEEIVGEIKDEYDLEAPAFRRLDDGSWDLDGAAELRELAAALPLELRDEGSSSTLAGLLGERAGRILRRGEKARLAGWEFEVTEADERRVLKLRARPLPGGPAA